MDFILSVPSLFSLSEISCSRKLNLCSVSRWHPLFAFCVLFCRSGLASARLWAQEASNAINVWREIDCPIETR